MKMFAGRPEKFIASNGWLVTYLEKSKAYCVVHMGFHVDGIFTRRGKHIQGDDYQWMKEPVKLAIQEFAKAYKKDLPDLFDPTKPFKII